MGSRRVDELPVPILTDEELVEEYDRTFRTAATVESENGHRGYVADVTVRRNAAALGELLRRGYRADTPAWSKRTER